MAGKHTKQEQCHCPDRIIQRKYISGRTRRQTSYKKNLNRKIPERNPLKRKLCCLIQKSILLVILAVFVIIGIRKSANEVVNSTTVNEKNLYKNAVSNERKEEEEELEESKLQKAESRVQKKTTNKGNLKKECNKIYNDNSQLLVLVNKDKILDENYDAGLKSICQGRLQVSQQIYSDLVQMLSDSDKAGFHYWIASAYRSRQYQQQLIDQDVNTFMRNGMTYEQALEKTYEETMPAGFSEHETGLALDILCSNNTKMDVSQEKEDANKWLQEHCHEYGFILRYPKDKEEITKINYEPWHFRYVGREAAEFMKKHNMALEEFYNMLEDI